LTDTLPPQRRGLAIVFIAGRVQPGHLRMPAASSFFTEATHEKAAIGY